MVIPKCSHGVDLCVILPNGDLAMPARRCLECDADHMALHRGAVEQITVGMAVDALVESLDQIGCKLTAGSRALLFDALCKAVHRGAAVALVAAED